MRLRDSMNNNSALVTVLAIVILIVSLGFIIYQARPNRYAPRVVDVYYYDLGSGQIFLGKSDKVSPIDAPSGPGSSGEPNGVRAYVFSCTNCDDESSRFIGWLEKYTPEAKQAMLNPPAPDTSGNAAAGPDPTEIWEKGHLIAAYKANAGELKWVVNNSDAGFRIMQSLETKCPGGQPNPCFPPQ